MSLLLRENKLCMETKGKSLFWCVMSESQPGHVNTLWVEQKCYRADETHSIYSMSSIVRFPGHVYRAVCNADFNTRLRYLLPLFCLGFYFCCRECWVGWGGFCPLSLEDARTFLPFTFVCPSWVQQHESASLLLHLPCTSLQPEVGTTWPLRSRDLGSWVSVASLNPSRSSLGSQVFHHPTELSPYQPWSC